MGTSKTSDASDRQQCTYARFKNVLILCAICVIVNIAGAQAALALKLPVFIDSLGTILAALLGGYVPAIIVGYLTNLINGVADTATLYYGIISVLIAIAAGYMANHGWFKKLPLILASIPIFALIGGGLGSVLTFFLYGAGIGEGISAPFAWQIYNAGLLDVFGAQLCADLFIDLIDKALTVLLAALIFHLLSEDFLAKLDFRPWQQAPLSTEEFDAAVAKESRATSLQTKLVIVVVAIMVFIAVTTTTISYLTFHQSMVEAESNSAQGITNLMKDAINPDRIDEYLTEGEQARGYSEVEQQLAEIRDSFPNLQYVYVYQIRNDGCHVVFDPDTDEEEGSDPGDVIPFDPSFEELIPTLLAGDEIDPIVSNDSYGWLLTVYTPVQNLEGDTVCYVAADVSMEQLVADESSFLTSITALFAGLPVLICAIVLWLARYGIVLPVNSIARAANNFMLGDESVRKASAEQMDKLDIRTGDEIENLFDSVDQMAREALRFTEEAQQRNATIGRMQDNLIMVMADLVESRDKFTGDHVKNTAAYTRIIMNQMRREGIYPDQLTNEFISNVYKSAPLHDIGKITVSDTILNKPGRFTDEEFKIMQNHTIAGQEILEGATGAVADAGYLDEAQRLAAYHHEKWDGSGYPHGTAGEDIPLSARIMAVADVFDALVSKRSYKEGFPIEKAFAIIEEGVGTHFDPQVARAFLHAQDKARAVAEKAEAAKRAAAEAVEAAEKTNATESNDANNDGGGKVIERPEDHME